MDTGTLVFSKCSGFLGEALLVPNLSIATVPTWKSTVPTWKSSGLAWKSSGKQRNVS